MTDHDRAEAALRFLSDHFEEQPSLDEIASAVHLSPYHFQRIFRRWVGISPKRFLQFLTVTHAKALLAQSRSVLDASLDAGLSGPGRLHDLFVSFEAVTPGEFKSQGQGLQMLWEVIDSPFGPAFVAATERGLCSLQFLPESSSLPTTLDSFRRRWQGATIQEGPVPYLADLESIFSQRSLQKRIPLLTQGTNFQIQVWQALIEIPDGAVCTYEHLAHDVGRPRAVRAVANAVGANPIHYLIPCHRVIRKMGVLGGYAGGLSRKRTLLAFEAARQEARLERVS